MQTIALYKETFNKLYIICSGRVEALGMLSDYYFNPLYIARASDVFGIEGLTNDPTSSATYIAMEDNVIVLSIKITDLLAYCQMHPDIFKHLLSEQSKLLRKFQKLWLTV